MTNPTTPSAETIEKVKELAEKHDSTIFLIEDSPTASEIVEHRFSGEDASHIAKLYNAFPSIASLCLEQAEEIERLRGALEWYAGKNLEGSSHIAEKALYPH